ncbi:hypothetical protein [Nocardia brasiliensis]|uniref:hypothetical protein n=1 Tax=Nocardia brasiliensis TaxID=37326 RepID=UPI003D8AC3E9
MRLFDSVARTRPEGQCFILVTADPDSTPRPCLLSVGEILVTDANHMRIAVWPNSRTTANLNRGTPVLLTCALPPDTFHVRAAPRPMAPVPAAHLVRFELTVTSVEQDVHVGLPVTRPMWFEATPDREAWLLEMWQAQLVLLGR